MAYRYTLVVLAFCTSVGLAEDADLTASGTCGCLGNVRLAYTKTDQEFALRAQFLPVADPATPYSVWFESEAGSGDFYQVGDMTLVVPGNADWRLELRATSQAPPALGVAELSELSGRLVQICEFASTNVVLRGALPLAMPPGKPTGDVWVGRLDLQRSDGLEQATGFVDLCKAGTHQTLSLRAWKLDWSPGWPNADRTFAALIETGTGTGAFEPAGYLKMKLKVGSNYDFKLYWELKLWSSTGAPAALDVGDLAELADRRVQVADDLGRVWLETVLPALALKSSLRSKSWRGSLSPLGEPLPSGQFRIKFDPKRGRSRCDRKTRGLPAGSAATVFFEDAPGAGTFTPFAALDPKGRLRRDTRTGDRLPFGVPRIIDLAGRLIEIRDPEGGVLLRGQLP